MPVRMAMEVPGTSTISFNIRGRMERMFQQARIPPAIQPDSPGLAKSIAAMLLSPPRRWHISAMGSSYSLPTEFVINPAGFFLENQDYANVISAKPSWSYPVISAWGVSEPSALLKTSSVATAAYAGFLFEASVSGAHLTRPVGFGGVPVSGTVMAGGTFPSEDPTKTPNTNMSIDFGKQDPLNNGIYYLAKLTIPVIANWPCTGTAGIDLSGNPTCTYNALARWALQKGSMPSYFPRLMMPATRRFWCCFSSKYKDISNGDRVVVSGATLLCDNKSHEFRIEITMETMNDPLRQHARMV